MNDDNYTIEDDEAPSWQSYSIEEVEEAKNRNNDRKPEGEGSQSAEEEKKRADEIEEVPSISFLKLFGVLLKVLLSPVEGWKNLKRLAPTPQNLNAYLFFPLTGLATLCRFCGAIFWNGRTIQEAIPEGVHTFCALFFGYFTTFLFGKLLLSKKGAEALDTPFGKNFVGLTFSSMALFICFYEALQVLQPVLIFLPIWTVYIIFKGVRFLGVEQDRQTSTSTILSVLIIGLPFLIDWIFSMFL